MERHGIRLRTLLFAMLVVPTLLTLTFGGLWTRDRSRAASHAERIAEQSTIIFALSDLQFALETNRLFSETQGSTTIDTSKFTEGQAKDVRKTYDSLIASAKLLLRNRTELDRLSGTSISALVEKVLNLGALRTEQVTDGSSAKRNAQFIAAFSAALTRIRDNADPATTSIIQPLSALSQLQTSMIDEGADFIKLISAEHPRETDGLGLFQTEAIQGTLIAQLKTQLTPRVANELDSVLALREMHQLRVAIAKSAGLLSDGPELKDVLGQQTIDKIARRYLSLPTYRADLTKGIIANSKTESQSARRALSQSIAATLVASLASIALSALISGVISSKLSQITERAIKIGNGDIDRLPLPPTGPREIRSATKAFNTMSDLLVTLECQIEAIGSNSLSDPSLSKSLPGQIGHDIEQSVRRITTTNAELRTAKELAASIIAAATDAIFTIDENGLILSANPAASRLTGVAESIIEGRRLTDLLGGLSQFDELTTQPAEQPQIVRRMDGAQLSTLVTARTITGGEGDAVRTLFVRDVSERAKWEQRFRYQASHDELTGLPNRFALQEHLDTNKDWLNIDRMVTAISLNLDRFHLVNDIHGHKAGDEVLRWVGRQLSQAAGSRSFVARVGGNEFVVVTQEAATHEEALEVAERLRESVSQPFTVGDERPVLNASAGIASSTTSDEATFELVRLADIALLHAKATRSVTSVTYDEAMSQSIANKSWIERNLRVALATGALEMFAQPIVNIPTGRIAGVELLARWRHEGKYIPPDTFIPIAEEAGLISSLGRWAMGAACDLLSDFAAAGLEQTVSVNISGLHLMGGEVANELAALLENNRFDPHKLKVELTESVLLADPDLAVQRLMDIRDLGPEIIIDDFGTGYSSLTYLHRLPIAGLKLDRSFVSGIGGAQADDTIVRLVIDLANGLSLGLVAEGVETSEERDALERFGYRLGQGYFWARPMPISELWAAIENNAAKTQPTTV